MPAEKQTGQTVAEKNSKLKNPDAYEVKNSWNEGKDPRKEQNHSKGNLPHDAQNYVIAQLMKMAQTRMVESEIEKKYLLYHIIKQSNKMKQMKQQMGILPELINKFPDLVGLANKSPTSLHSQARRRRAGRERFRSFGGDYTYDMSSEEGFKEEDQEVLRMLVKLPDVPEMPKRKFGYTNINWSNPAKQIPSKKLDFVRDAYEISNLNKPWDEKQASALLLDNLKDTVNPTNATSEENTSQNQKFDIELFKTEICRSWAKFGLCPYGLSCRFAHGPDELRLRPKPHWKYKTEMCNKYLSGYCPYGSRCYFVHKPHETVMSRERPMRVELHSAQNRDMTRRWQRKPTRFHPCNTQERM